MLKTLFSSHCMNTCQIKGVITNATKVVLSNNQCVKNSQQSIIIIRSKTKWPKEPQWPAGFEEPVPHKRDIPAIRDSGEYEKKALAPIKSAHKSATCSLFQDPLIQKFKRLCTVHGRAQQAENNMMETYRIIKHAQLKKYYKVAASLQEGSLAKEDSENISITTDPSEIIRRAIENARPLMKIEKVLVGSVEYQVPAPITKDRSEWTGMKWIVDAARDRDKSKSLFREKLAEVLLETASMTGRVINTKNEHHKTCELNRAFAHFRRGK